MLDEDFESASIVDKGQTASGSSSTVLSIARSFPLQSIDMSYNADSETH